MKFMISQLSYLFREREARRNLRALLKYLVFVVAVITVYAVMFHFIMFYAEGQRHSWLTGFYWTLTVMSTLGFGDITFHTDVGRMFSIVVLLSGIVLLLIVLPFAFIRFFYAPWLEAQIRLQAPRSVPEETRGHVVICRNDSITRGLVRKLEFNHIPYFVLEPDVVAAGRMSGDELSVIAGDLDSRETYERLRVGAARMVFANAEDTVNTNITLTIREVEPQIPIVALAEDEDSIDILQLSGATHVLPLKQRLGEHLAARVNVGASSAHVVGRFRDLLIAEFVVHGTELVGRTLRETRLRERTGVNVVGVWLQGHLQPVRRDLRLEDHSVPVVIGTQAQVEQLDRLLVERDAAVRPVLVIGGGKVGRAAAEALKRRGVPVHVVERRERARREFAGRVDRLVIGDAADREVLEEAGLNDVPAVMLTTSDDAINIYLTVYCRRLQPDINIVSRINHERNIEAIYRAGADSVLSYASLGREYVISLLLGREPVMVGEGADFFLVPVPPGLVGKTLGESELGSHTGLIVIAVEDGEQTRTNPGPTVTLPAGCRLVLLGTAEQRQRFSEEFES